MSYQDLNSAYAGAKQRWVVVYSPEAYQNVTVDHDWRAKKGLEMTEREGFEPPVGLAHNGFQVRKAYPGLSRPLPKCVVR